MTLDFDQFQIYQTLVNEWQEKEFGGHDAFNDQQMQQMFRTICSLNKSGNNLVITKDSFYKHVTMEIDCVRKLEE